MYELHAARSLHQHDELNRIVFNRSLNNYNFKIEKSLNLGGKYEYING